MLMPKYNPFRPNGITHSGMFVGRIDELSAIQRCLFQAKNGNPQHFLIQGERGIGKSSLLFYVDILVDGSIKMFGGGSFNFLSVPVDLGGCLTQADVVKKIGRGLRSAIGKKQALKERAKGVWDWLSSWEVLGVQYHKADQPLDLEEVAEEFVDQLALFSLQMGEDLDGVLFLIDEADRPPVESGLGSYLKLITERLSWRQCSNIVFGLAGLPGLLARLRESHESSPRLFHTLKLEPLEIDERKQVVRLGIAEANKKNSIVTSIDDDAVDFLADLSEGYPHFLQQFSYSAFEIDLDNVISMEDVSDGAFKDGGALSQLGDKFFSEMYHARISSEDYRRVLDAMADHGDSWISRKIIIDSSGVKDTNVTNALQALKNKAVILQDDTRRGYYRLPTNSFAAWINAIRAARAKSDVEGSSVFEG